MDLFGRRLPIGLGDLLEAWHLLIGLEDLLENLLEHLPLVGDLPLGDEDFLNVLLLKPLPMGLGDLLDDPPIKPLAPLGLADLLGGF